MHVICVIKYFIIIERSYVPIECVENIKLVFISLLIFSEYFYLNYLQYSSINEVSRTGGYLGSR